MAEIFIKLTDLREAVIEILLLFGALLVLLAKRSSRRRMTGYKRGNIDDVLDIGTLAANTLISAALGGTVSEKTLVSSAVATWSVSDWTLAAGDGPLMVGYAHSDYTDAEIEAWIETSGSWQVGSKVQDEISKRLIRHVGTLVAPPNENIGSQAILNDGKPIKTKLNWVLATGQTLRIWAYNAGDSAFGSTDPDMHVQGHANLFPR